MKGSEAFGKHLVLPTETLLGLPKVRIPVVGSRSIWEMPLMIDYVYVVNASGEGHLDILHGGVALYGDSGETGNHHVWWVKKNV